jgi:chaperonin GroES
MAVNLTPLHDRVIVRRIEEKESVKGGIIIPDSAKEKQQEGEVIAVGPGKREKDGVHPLDVKVGDRVLFGKYGGTEIKICKEVTFCLTFSGKQWPVFRSVRMKPE